VINGDTINQKLAAKAGLIQTLLDSKSDNRNTIERIYLAALSRYPSDEEIRTLSQAMDTASARGGPDSPRRPVLEDLAWAVLTGREFLFNH